MNIQIQITGWAEATDEPLVSTSFGSRERSPHQFLFNRLAKAIPRAVPAFFALLLLALPAVAQAQFGDTTNNGAITITGYTGPGGAVTIPSAINGLPVTRIGDKAFYYCSSLTSVAIPNSVTSIGDFAFWECRGLTSVTIPNSVISIGDFAFADSSLFNVTIGNSVTSIGDEAFEDCHSLTSVTIGNSVTNIGGSAFYLCSRLTNAIIGNSVTSIGDGAFGICSNLTVITVDTNNPAYSSVNGVLFDKSQTTLVQYPGGLGGSYAIPDSVTSIGYGAFAWTGLTSVTIGNSVTSIGDSAFSNCSNLTNAIIGNSVTSIGDGAFGICSNLTGVTFPDSVTIIGYDAFFGCSSLTNVTIGDSLASIGNGAFAGCFKLTEITVDTNNPVYSSVNGVLFDKSQTTLVAYPGGLGGSYTIPDSVTSIGDTAFWECSSLTNVTIGNGVTHIGDAAFEDCESLISVYFKGNAPTADEAISYGSLFDSDDATAYYLPGTTGWDYFSANTGIPAVLWFLPNPLILNSSPGFGVQTNRFGFIISWATNTPVVVEACANLFHPAWIPVGTNTLTGGSSYFSDPQWTNHPARFYRLRAP